VVRKRNPSDGRSVHILLTDEGIRVVDAAMTELVRREAEVLAGSDRADIVALTRALRPLMGPERG
jgi:DNA-binding MarR family transcriptional regulator